MRRNVVSILACAALVLGFSAWLSSAIPEAIKAGKESGKGKAPRGSPRASTNTNTITNTNTNTITNTTTSTITTTSTTASADGKDAQGSEAAVASAALVRVHFRVSGRTLDAEGRPLHGARVTLGATFGRTAHTRPSEAAVSAAMARTPLERRGEVFFAMLWGQTIVDLGSARSDGAGEFAIDAAGEIGPGSTLLLTACFERGREKAAGNAHIERDSLAPDADLRRDVTLSPVPALVVAVSSRGAPVPGAEVLARTERPRLPYGRFGGRKHMSGSWSTESFVTDRPTDEIAAAIDEPCLTLVATTDERGEAELTVESSWAILSVARPGYATDHVRVDPGAGRVQVELAPESLLEGLVQDAAGHPVANVLVRAFDASGVGRSEETRSREDGRFALRDVRAGRAYAIWAALDGKRALLPARTLATAPASNVGLVLVDEARVSLRLALAPGELTGRDSPYVSPCFLLERKNTDGTWEKAAYGEGPLVHDEAPLAWLAGLRPGTHRLRVGGRGLAPLLTEPFELVAGDQPSPLRFELRRGRSISGRVVSSSGQPLEAFVSTPGWREWWASEHSSATHGAFRIDDLGWGELDLNVRASGWKTASVRVAAGETSAGDIVLEREER